jgi:HSP20 family protein
MAIIKSGSPRFQSPFFSAFRMPALPSFPTTIDDLIAQANSLVTNGNGAEFAAFPVVNIKEAADEFVLSAELPGLSEKDVDVDYSDGILTISGEKSEEKEEKGKEGEQPMTYVYERRFGSFKRSFTFPGDVAGDKIGAEFRNGVLTIKLPKVAPAKRNSRKIPVAAKQ